MATTTISPKLEKRSVDLSEEDSAAALAREYSTGCYHPARKETLNDPPRRPSSVETHEKWDARMKILVAATCKPPTQRELEPGMAQRT